MKIFAKIYFCFGLLILTNAQTPKTTQEDQAIINNIIEDFFNAKNNNSSNTKTLDTKIQTENALIKKWNTQLESLEKEFNQSKAYQNFLYTQLDILNQKLQILEKKQQEQERLRDSWEKELTKVTAEKKVAEQQIRIWKKQYQKEQQSEYLLRSLFSDEYLRYQLLFSHQTTGEIFESLHYRDLKTASQKQVIRNLESFNQKLKNKELRTAELYKQISTISEQINTETKAIKKATQERQRFARSQIKKQRDISQQIDTYRNKKNQSESYLNELHSEQVSKEFRENLPNFIYPFLGKPDISATFLDEKYRELTGYDHTGVDFVLEPGSDILATRSGTVSEAYFPENLRDPAYVIIDHNNSYKTIYGHLSSIDIKKGQSVQAGQVIGKSGGAIGERGSGIFSSGPHLQFEILKDNEYIDPLIVLPQQK